MVLFTQPSTIKAAVPPDPGCSTGDSPLCLLPTLGNWINNLPAKLWDMATATAWPWLPLAALLLLLVAVGVPLAQRMAWRRAAAGGYWVAITPPRAVDVARSVNVWNLLSRLARRAGRGWWRLAHPPLTLEVHASRGRLLPGLWLPGWVPFDAARDAVSQAWPGALVAKVSPPVPMNGRPYAVAAYRLAAQSDTRPLLYEAASRSFGTRGYGADPMGAVLATLGQPEGPAVLQVLVRTVPGRRIKELESAARGQPPKPRRSLDYKTALRVLLWLLRGVLRLALAVLDAVFSGPGSSASNRSANGSAQVLRDPLRRLAARDATAKLRDGPHLLGVVRVAVGREGNSQADTAAYSAAHGFAVAASLSPVRVKRPRTAFADRWAGPGDWTLFTAAELATLAHLPADPALYGFDTAALHRPHPFGVARPAPESPDPKSSGWSQAGWTTPPKDESVDNEEEHDDEDDDWI